MKAIIFAVLCGCSGAYGPDAGSQWFVDYEPYSEAEVEFVLGAVYDVVSDRFPKFEEDLSDKGGRLRFVEKEWFACGSGSKVRGCVDYETRLVTVGTFPGGVGCGTLGHEMLHVLQSVYVIRGGDSDNTLFAVDGENPDDSYERRVRALTCLVSE